MITIESNHYGHYRHVETIQKVILYNGVMTSQTKIPPTELLQPYFFITASLHPPSPGKFLFPSPLTPSPRPQS